VTIWAGEILHLKIRKTVPLAFEAITNNNKKD
jgi:hypothetical protein